MRVIHARAGRGGPREIYIGRSGAQNNMLTTDAGRPGWLGNPFTERELDRTQASVQVKTRKDAITRFEVAFLEKIENDPGFRDAVLAIPGDAVLVCWCKPKACHGDVIAKWLDEHREGESREGV